MRVSWQEGRPWCARCGAFPGHIACSSLSRSEIVVPVFHLASVGVLDVDSAELNDFDEKTRWLEELVTDWGNWGK